MAVSRSLSCPSAPGLLTIIITAFWTKLRVTSSDLTFSLSARICLVQERPNRLESGVPSEPFETRVKYENSSELAWAPSGSAKKGSCDHSLAENRFSPALSAQNSISGPLQICVSRLSSKEERKLVILACSHDYVPVMVEIYHRHLRNEHGSHIVNIIIVKEY